jgi:hypothetical protein
MNPAKRRLTSIELFVILGIVFFVPAVLVASLDSARELAKIPLCQNNLRLIGKAVYEYAQIYDGNLPNVVDAEGNLEYHMYVQYRGDNPEYFVDEDVNGKMIPFRFACLYEAGLIEPRSFYCPANVDLWRKFESYTNPEPWGTLPQVYNQITASNQWVRSGYEWFPIDQEPELYRFSLDGRPRAPKYFCVKLDNLDSVLPYSMDYQGILDSFSHSYDGNFGLNLLYSDGRVEYFDNPDVMSQPIWSYSPSGKTYSEVMSIYYYRMLLVSGRQPHEDDLYED